ncbi:MAG: protein-disulfide reductase DsbD [Brevundimonas sp.]|uniref:protein-disulfide reductase DsbD n=1 Tax=Brevundimonas sp. TaxID=1871086 RepID=UPI002ABC5213|nr:protein-disulfide reductase DsbD [Brevundimonas sp.]MDZ4112940.1 protein-disulfide reductase DsbD [Brevundimonas sp.]
MKKRFAFVAAFRLAFAVMVMALTGGLPAAAQAPLSPQEAFKLSVTRTQAGDVSFRWRIAPGHYLYRGHTVATTADGKTALALDLAPGQQKDDPGFGVVEIWHDAGQATLAQATLEGAGSPQTINITYQGCVEDSICYPPVTETVALPVLPEGRAAPAQTLATSDPSDAVAASASALAIAAAEASFGESPGGVAASGPVASGTGEVQLQSGGGLVESLSLHGGALWVLLAFFGFGILLAFTPCVFPMYPILAGVIGRGVDGRDPRRGFILSGSYVLGLASAFALLGMAAAWSGQNLQMALQSVWAVGALSLVFVVLAASMFGLFELQLPAAWTSRLSVDRGTGRRSAPSAAGMGFVSALIVGPYVTAPLAGALLYIAQTGDLALGAGALFALGLGKGVPLIMFGTMGARLLPKAGPWMNRVKVVFGFLFLATAWWLGSRILPPVVTLVTGAALLLMAAAALGLFQSDPAHGLGARMARVAGLAATVWGVMLLVGAGAGATDPLQPLEPFGGARAAAAPQDYSETVVTDEAGLRQATALASQSGRPSLVYFTADWCVSCKVIEREVFEDPEVRARLGEVSLIKVDVTKTDAEARSLMEAFAVVGPPTMIFLDAEAREPADTRIVGETGAKGVLEALTLTQGG